MAEQTALATQNELPPASIQASEKPHHVQMFELQQRAARLFAMSGLFADIRGQNPEQSIAQAFVKISLGESMGFNPAESMTGIDIIQGRVAISANMRAARMQRAGYEWDILQLDDKGCRLQLKHQGKVLMCEQVNEKTGEVTKVPLVISFTEQDAEKAGLLGKDNYKKNPRNMYFARAITNAQRWYAPGILSMNILSSEEAADIPALESTPSGAPQIEGNTRTEQVKNAVRSRARSAAQTAQPAAQEEHPQAQPETQAQETEPAQEASESQPQQQAQPEPTTQGASLW